MDRLEDLRKKRRITDDTLREIDEEIAKLERIDFTNRVEKVNKLIGFINSQNLIKNIKELEDLKKGLEIFGELLLEEGCLATEESFTEARKELGYHRGEDIIEVYDLQRKS